MSRRAVILAFLIGLVAGALLTTAVRSASRSGQEVIPVPPSMGLRQPDPTHQGPPAWRDLPAPSPVPADDPVSVPPQPSPSPRKQPATTAGPATATPSRVTKHRLTGAVTFYAACRRCGAAGPDLRRALGRGYLGDRVKVSWRGRSVWVRIVTSCACGDRRGQNTLIDLSEDAIAQLTGDWRSRGVLYGATVSW